MIRCIDMDQGIVCVKELEDDIKIAAERRQKS